MQKTIYLAGGCFWGLQHYFDLAPGVIETEVGYANSNISDPTYEQVCTGATNAAETVKIVYDSDTVSLRDIVNLFLHAVDPTQVNRQGNDVGTQYRNGIFSKDEDTLRQVRQLLHESQKHYASPIATEVTTLQNFFPAEEYHQDYLGKNPRGYCHIGTAAFKYAKEYIPAATESTSQ